MATDTAAVRMRADELHSRYRFAFAGRPRITRRVEDLDAIIAAAEVLLREASTDLGDDDPAVAELRGRVALYKTERAEIVTAQAQGPAVRRATVLGSRANGLFGLYTRHFANQSRLTRDVALLDDLIDALGEIKGELVALAAGERTGTAEHQLRAVEKNVELYVAEREAIVAARAAATTADRTSLLAALANAQFEAYRIHFAGRPRLSRRLALLDRLMGTLEWCRSGMAELAAEGGDQADTNASNLRIVEDRLTAWHAERGAIVQARQQASVFELIDALGDDANAVMEEYVNHFAGQDRASRELDRLAALLDRLVETERQMWALTRVHDNPANERNVAIVHDTLAVYAREYDAIREAQSN